MIAVVGSTNLDIVMYVERFTKPGETQKAKKLEYFPGGKGANQAVTVAKLSGMCIFLSALGKDGEEMAKRFEEFGIEGFVMSDEKTGRAFIEVTKDGQNRIIIFSGANAKLTKELIASHSSDLLRADILLIQNEVPFESSLEAAKIFKKAGKTVIFDPAPAQGIGKEIFQYVDFLTPNEEEMKALTKEFFGSFQSFEDSSQKFLGLGVENVIVKLGEKGLLLFGKEENFALKAFDVKAVDSTAAGDVFNGAFAVALDEGNSIKDALIFASAAAAISVTRKGAQSSIPSREEVETFLSKTIG